MFAAFAVGSVEFGVLVVGGLMMLVVPTASFFVTLAMLRRWDAQERRARVSGEDGGRGANSRTGG